MKMKMFIIAVTLFSLYTYNLFAQWQPDVRLTNSLGGSYTSYNNAWCVASAGDSVHAVWADNRDGNYEVYYKRSMDGGASWGTDTRLTNNSAISTASSVSVSGTFVHVVWYDERHGTTDQEIYYIRSSDGGSSWGADTRLTNNIASSLYPSVAASGSDVHVVWYDQRTFIHEIYYKHSTDGGLSWGADLQLTNVPGGSSAFPSVSVTGSVVHVVWSDFRDGLGEIYYTRSTNGGSSWGANTRLTNDTGPLQNASVSASGSGVNIVWCDSRDGNNEIYHKRSTDAGINWGADTRMTTNSAASNYPSVSVSGQAVHVAWNDSRDGNYEIYYKCSTDGGTIWGADTRLTNNSAFSDRSSISVSGLKVHIVWYDLRNGSNPEIYYKRDPTGNPSNSSLSLNLTAFIEGFYNPVSNNMISDTARVYLRNNSAPYNIIDSSKGTLNSSGTGTFLFSNVVNGVNYYTEVKHRNSIRTWNKTAIAFSGGLLIYDFSNAANKAFGDNQKEVDATPVRFSFYSGDFNQDGSVNLTDVVAVFNASGIFLSGYLSTDMNGDNISDLSDVIITNNNSNNFVSVVRP